jgi:hypothetical protein
MLIDWAIVTKLTSTITQPWTAAHGSQQESDAEKAKKMQVSMSRPGFDDW